MDQERFRMDEPDKISPTVLLALLRRRAERLLQYEEIRARGEFFPEVLMMNERALLDQACGEWVARRQDAVEFLVADEPVPDALDQADIPCGAVNTECAHCGAQPQEACRVIGPLVRPPTRREE